MKYVHDRKESGTVVILDDHHFVNCEFTDCQVLYAGGDFAWANTRFVNCNIGLNGPAARTQNLLGFFGWRAAEGKQPVEPERTAKPN